MSTRFEETSCAGLQAQDRVEAKGIRQQPDGSVLAVKIEGDDDEDDDEGRNRRVK